MISACTRFSLAAILAIAATASAEPVPAPTPSPPAGPVPVPYPNPDPPPVPECPASLCPKATAQAHSGPAYLKFGGVEGESADDRHKDQIEILSWSWGEGSAASGDMVLKGSKIGENSAEANRANDRLRNSGPTNGWDTSDPQEGGQVARTKPKLSEIPIVKVTDKSTPVMTSDPQEGGEIAGKLPGLHKPSDVTLKRGTMGSETTARDAAGGLATGKRVHKPMTMTRGSVTVTMPEGVCVAGAHYPAVTLTSGDEAFAMQDVTVASCTPVTTAKGRKDKAKLDYMVVKMETVLISG